MGTVLTTILTSLLSLAALTLSIYTFRVQRIENSYADIDEHYLGLLKAALDDPRLRSYEQTSTFYKLPANDVFRIKYDIYAFMCWNLVETIFDRQKDRRGQFRLSPTWVPVMVEENRLHYTWFKHNLRLFKPDFQRFVVAELNDIELVEGRLPDFEAVYRRFEVDFPATERKDRSHIELLLSKKKYRLFLAKHRIFDRVIGYAFIYEPDSPKVIWLDYMAIDVRFQNAGYGTLLFNKVAQLRGTDCLGVMMEVEPVGSPDDQKRRDQARRIDFYKRLGAVTLDVDYQLPTEDGALPMHLMFRPSPGVHLLPKDQIQEAVAATFDYVHSDIPHRDAVFKRFIASITDLYL